MKIGLVLEGGAMRGLYTAGVLDVFMENNISVDGIIGVSAGALFGMNYKSKQPGRVLRYNKNFAGSKEYMGLHSLLTTGNVMNKDFCFNKIVHELDPVDFDTFQRSKEEFYAVVTNIETGKAEYIGMDDLRDEEQMEYLRASGSMPFLSTPVCVRGKRYLDGGIADSIPIGKIMSMGYDRVIVILTRPEDYRKKKTNTLLPKLYYRKYPSLVSTINNRYRAYNQQLERVSALAEAKKIFAIRPSKLVKIKRLEKDMGKIQEMYDLGREDAVKSLAAMMEYLNGKGKIENG